LFYFRIKPLLLDDIKTPFIVLISFPQYKKTIHAITETIDCSLLLIISKDQSHLQQVEHI